MILNLGVWTSFYVSLDAAWWKTVGLLKYYLHNPPFNLGGWEVWVVCEVWVVRLVKKRQLAPCIPNKTHFLNMPQAAGKKPANCCVLSI